MKTVHLSAASVNLDVLFDQVVKNGDVTIISRPNTRDLVVMSLEHYSSLMETAHLLSSPANAAHLAKSLAQACSGQITERELIEPDKTGVPQHAPTEAH